MAPAQDSREEIGSVAVEIFPRWLDTAARKVVDDAEFDVLLHGLDAIRRSVSAAIWRHELLPILHLHELYGHAIQCPFSARATAKPRGYAGDALLLDFLYREPTISALWESATPLGRAICDFWVASPAAAAVRERRDLAQARLDQLAARKPGASVLAVSCGHLREVSPGSAAPQGAFRRFVAHDQDEESLNHIARYRPFAGLELRRQTVGVLVGSVGAAERFDFIYALCLLDYLQDRFARGAVARLFDALEPGGSLLVANCLPSTPNIAAMEAFQDWSLIYRTREEIEALGSEIPADRIARRTYLETGCIGTVTWEAS